MSLKHRIKKESQFLKEYGPSWRTWVQWNSDGYMDYLFGKQVLETQSFQLMLNGVCAVKDSNGHKWFINQLMVETVEDRFQNHKERLLHELTREC